MHITFVLGTRPEIVKLAPVIHEARQRKHHVQVILTGQHRSLAIPLLASFQITPDRDLAVMTHDQTLSSLAERILTRLNENIDLLNTDTVIVQGDTTSAFIAAYWAFSHHIPIAHIEAGLRTYDLRAPFPEEANRQLIARIATFHFAPTAASGHALTAEGIPLDRIFNVGNTGIDAIQLATRRLDGSDELPSAHIDRTILDFIGDRKLILVTAHRRENIGPPLSDICSGLRAVADARQDVRIVLPVHPNPAVRATAYAKLSDHPRILLCDPRPYFEFVALMKLSSLIVTDSGGLQEEAPSLKKPVLVLRNSTERTEGIAAGFSRLIGTNPDAILSETLKALDGTIPYNATNPYGDGKASQRILDILESRGMNLPTNSSNRARSLSQ